MTTLDSDLGFEDILRRTAEIIKASTQDQDPPEAKSALKSTPAAGFNFILPAIAAGLGIAAAVTLVTGYSALISDTPGIWIHRLMALMMLQSVLVAAVAMKVSPLLEHGTRSVRVAIAPSPETKASPAETKAPPSATTGPVANSAKVEPRFETGPLPVTREPTIGGTLAGRQYLQHVDGTIEIDTLIGRRRFVSIEAAKEFVGA